MLPDRQHDQEELLASCLRQLLGPIDTATLDPLRAELRWVEVPAGQVLMRQGEAGDAMYIAISGRLRAEVCNAAGQRLHTRELARGRVMGEMSLFTDEPRTATVLALRDSVLVRLDKPAFQRLLADGGPLSQALSGALTRQLVQRLVNDDQRSTAAARPITLSLLAASPGVDVQTFAATLAQALGGLRLAGQLARVRVVNAAAVDAALSQPGLAQRPLEDAGANRQISLWLDHVEAHSDFVILLADGLDTDTGSGAATAAGQATPWAQRCSRHGDERLLLVDATQPPGRHTALGPEPERGTAADVLLLLHPAHTRMPRNTAAWLNGHPGAQLLHLRQGHAGDMARLARIQARRATALVLAGGGARGLAHLGVWRALRERGIEIDMVGGTSIGAVMAALIASDRSFDEVLAIARRAFGTNPTGDYNLVPLLSLIQGRRLKRVIDTASDELAGPGCQVEDLWKPYFCVAANYSRACEQVVRRGPLAKMIRASLSIPGALPPVAVDGDLLCDGGTFNNFPVDVMRGLHGMGPEGRVIGVDLSMNKPRSFDFDEVPGPWALARDRLRPKDQRRYKLPSLTAYLMNVTVLYSHSRREQARQLTDLHFNPPLHRVGMLQWHRFEHIVQQGYEHAVQVLDAPSSSSSPQP